MAAVVASGVEPRPLTLYCEGRVSEYLGRGDVGLALVALESWDLRDAADLSSDEALASAFDALLLAGQSTRAARAHFVEVSRRCLERYLARTASVGEAPTLHDESRVPRDSSDREA